MRAGQGPRADDPWVRGAAWLRDVYGGLVEPAVPPNREPVYETGAAWLPACRAVPQPGFPEEPMLAASVVVPKDGGTPFHLSPGDPLADLEAPGTAARRADRGGICTPAAASPPCAAGSTAHRRPPCPGTPSTRPSARGSGSGGAISRSSSRSPCGTGATWSEPSRSRDPAPVRRPGAQAAPRPGGQREPAPRARQPRPGRLPRRPDQPPRPPRSTAPRPRVDRAAGPAPGVGQERAVGTRLSALSTPPSAGRPREVRRVPTAGSRRETTRR